MHSHFWMHCIEAVENPNRNCWCQLKQDYAHMTDSPSQLSKEQCKSLLIDFYKSIMLKRQQTSTSHSRIPVWLPGLQGSRWTWALVSLLLCPRQCHHRPMPPQPQPGPSLFGQPPFAHPRPHSALSRIPLPKSRADDKNTASMSLHRDKAWAGRQQSPQLRERRARQRLQPRSSGSSRTRSGTGTPPGLGHSEHRPPAPHGQAVCCLERINELHDFSSYNCMETIFS